MMRLAGGVLWERPSRDHLEDEMRVFTIVNGYTGALCLRELIEQGHQVVGVVTSPPARPGGAPEETVIGVATKHLLPVYLPPNEVVAEPAPEFVDLMRKAQPDLLVSMHYAAIFKPVLLEIPPLGAVNVHPSKVPEGRGMTPSFWYLYLGRDTAWTALHYLDPGIDSGDVIAHASVPITHDDTGPTLSRKLSEAAWMVFREHLPAIMAGNAPRQKQDLAKGSYLRSGFDWGLLQWSREAKAVRGHIRCFTNTGSPVRTSLGGLKLTVNDAELAGPEDCRGARESAVPGEVLAITGKGPLVQTGEGQVVLTDFAVEENKAANLMPLLGGRTPVILG
jgi:methionyl-tRNA formyltransferase